MSKIRLVTIVAVVFLAILPILGTTIPKGACGNQTPIASFFYSPEIPAPEQMITFDASASYDPDGWITKYSWNFGDGNMTVVTNPIITHAYHIDGNYTVELAVTDNSQAVGVACAVVEVSTEVFFRVCFYGTLTPMSGVGVTMYYNSGTAWVKAPVASNKLELRYDSMTQPDLANTPAEKYRNPGYTASMLLQDASNIGFDIHPSSWKVFFKFQWGETVTYWPNHTTRVYTYDDGVAEAHDYSSHNDAEWDPTAGTYVIRAKDIPKNGVSPCQNSPIIVGILCPPPKPKYYLAVRTVPSDITTIPGQGWYSAGTNVTLNAPQYVNVSADTRYRFSYWDVDGASRGAGVNPITITMNANHTATAHYVQQYLITFTQSGLAPDATGTVVTADGSSKILSDLPFTKWVDSGSSVTYSYTSPVTSSVTGKRYRLNGVTGSSSPITVTGAVTVTGNYVTQYLVTFAQTGLDSTATGTVVTVNSVAKTYTDLSYSAWFDSGASITYSYNSVVSSTVTGKRFRLVAVHSPTSPFTVTEPVTITGEYCKQYQVTFAQSGLDSTATGTVVTVNGNAKLYTDLPYSFWVDSGSSVTYSYNDVVLSSTSGKRFKLVNLTGPASPITISNSTTVTGNYKTQYQVTFDQSGVGTDFTGIVVTIDSSNYGVSGLPTSPFWWDQGSSHSFAFVSPLVVNATKQYVWTSTFGLSSQQSGTLTIGAPGSVVGSYVAQNLITFDQLGASSDFTGTVVSIDGNPYSANQLPKSFHWQVGTNHTFAFQSPLVVGANTKRYVWTSTTGLSTLQSGNITVTAFGSIVAHYKTQYYLTLATNPSAVTFPSGTGWYDANSFASISTVSLVDIVPGSSRHKFSNWTTADMTEIADPSALTTAVLMDKAKTVTANYVTQYSVTFAQSGVGSDFAGNIVTVDLTAYTRTGLPVSLWFDNNSVHAFAFSSPLIVNASRQYDWSSTVGLSTLQSGNLAVTGPGSVTGNYAVHLKYFVTFSQTGVGPDFPGTILIIDGNHYDYTGLSVSFWWDSGSSHTFAFQSPFVVVANVKRYVWTSTTGFSTSQSETITVSGSGSVAGNYKTQYYLNLDTNPPGVDSPSGEGWYDVGTLATISTDAFVDIVPGSSRYRFNGWTTSDMPEITDPSRSPTTVLMDKGKTVTANYAIQYAVVFDQTGVGPDFSGTVVLVDSSPYTVSSLPTPTFWWDNNSVHTFAFQSPLIVTANSKQYNWTSTTGLSTAKSGSITITTFGSVVGNYRTQYYLTVNSLYDSPNPTSRWYDAGTSITASVTSPASGPTGTRYLCTGWAGTGSVPASGTANTVTFTINAASSITWNWKTQYFLTVGTIPAGITAIPGQGWYDVLTSVTLTAPPVTDYTFNHWKVDGISRGTGVNPITVTMDAAHTAVAYYEKTLLPLSVTISPMETNMYLHDSVWFTATVSGGTSPYTYQWYVNGNPVSGATGSTWSFTPPSIGTYFVYVNVTDSHGNTTQSGNARVTVAERPQGGYSISLTKPIAVAPLLGYAIAMAVFCMAISLFRRKRK